MVRAQRIHAVFAWSALLLLVTPCAFRAAQSTSAGSIAVPDGEGGGRPAPDEVRATNARRIPCPFLAALYRRGLLKPNPTGQVSSLHIKEAMVAAGSTEPNAIFPAMGTARFEKGDIHQSQGRYFDYGLVPVSLFNDALKHILPSQPGYNGSRLYLNLMTMNVPDKCIDDAGHAAVPSEFPCNANPQHVQHGYSTTVRDPRYDSDDPTRTKRFDDWIGRYLVTDPTVSHNASEKVMNFAGFASMLKRMATEGDQSSEWSLHGPTLEHEGSNIAHYHPSLTLTEARALYAWTPYLAWVGLWEAYGIPNADGSKGKYMTEGQLRSFFLDSDMPAGWKPSPFCLKDVGYTMIALANHSIPPTDDYSSTLAKDFPLSGWLPSWGAEWRYMVNYMNTDTELGFFKDNIINPMPPSPGRARELII